MVKDDILFLAQVKIMLGIMVMVGIWVLLGIIGNRLALAKLYGSVEQGMKKVASYELMIGAAGGLITLILALVTLVFEKER